MQEPGVQAFREAELMASYGVITEPEAVTRELVADHMTADGEGHVTFYNDAARVQWCLTDELPDTPAPPWAGGLPVEAPESREP